MAVITTTAAAAMAADAAYIIVGSVVNKGASNAVWTRAIHMIGATNLCLVSCMSGHCAQF